MRKINTLFSATSQFNNSQFNSELGALAKNVQAHQQLQQFWQAALPTILAENSFAGSITNGQLVVYADSAIVANKIKLMQASLLTQLENLQKNNLKFREYKVTAIKVKVQVKSRPKTIIKPPRKLSNNAAVSLKNLASSLGDSSLATKLNLLASKSK